MIKLKGRITNVSNLTAQVTKVGPAGVDGKSAYEIWLELGNTGSEKDFIESLKGEPGWISDYNDLKGKPLIEGVVLEKNKSLNDFGIEAITKTEIKFLL